MYYGNSRYRKDLKETLELTDNFEKLHGKTFLIAGASGLIASFLIDVLFYANEAMNTEIKVYALVRDKEYAMYRYSSIVNHPDFHLIVQDVCDPLALRDRVDYIVHAAGDGYPKAFAERPVETMLPAMTGTWRLLEYAREIGQPRFLYVSSGEIYGEMSANASAARISGFLETDSGYVDTMLSRSCYPCAKRAAETLCASYHAEYGVDVVVARLSHVYGPNTSKKDNRATVQFFRDVLEGRDVVLKSKGEQKRSYTYVADCVSGLLTVLIKGTAGEAYNIANPEARATIAGFAQAAAEAGGCKCLFALPDRENVKESTPIQWAVLNSDKLQSLGWRGGYDVYRGIRHTLQILKDNDNPYI